LSRDDSHFQGSVTSSPRNPFTDSHAISSLTDVTVGDLDAVEMSTYQSEDNSGRFMDFLSSNKYADCRSEGAVVMDLHGRDASTTSIVATFPTEVFSGDRTDREGETLTMSQHRWLPADSVASISTRSSRRFVQRLLSSKSIPVLTVLPAAAALSLHQEDGSTPRLVTAPLVNVPDQLTDAKGEYSHLWR
jgi:hypothetical protein